MKHLSIISRVLGMHTRFCHSTPMYVPRATLSLHKSYFPKLTNLTALIYELTTKYLNKKLAVCYAFAQ